MVDELFGDDTENMDDEASGDPTWDSLKPSERKTLLDEVFQDDDWYDGTAYYVGGTANPAFDEIATRIGANSKTIKKYYAAWLSARGLDAKAAFAIPGSIISSTGPDTSEGRRNTPGQHIEDMMRTPVSLPPPPVMPPTGGDSTSNSVFAMMSFMGQQQALQLEAMKFQTYQQMEQRRLDQQREIENRREQMARDQQFLTQQMAFMRDMMKKSDNDGFFDGEMKGIFKEKMVDQLLGNNEGGAIERVASKLLNSDVLSAVATGASAMAQRKSVPAGYDVPSYDPYAQEAQPIQQVQQVQPVQQQPVQVVEAQPMMVEQEELPGFFSEGVTEPEPVFEDFSPDQYKMEILNAWKQIPGKAEELQDPKRLKALQERIEIGVEIVMTEHSKLIPQKKMELMVERILLIDSVRDIGLGIRQAMDFVNDGMSKDTVLSQVRQHLTSNPVLANTFATNSYEELIAKIKPFEGTGGLHHDVGFLQRPDTANFCREILASIAA
tara:strand:+ start:631 stop:2115 length:1485 start_codon:yes stop_codon:yes gene_type:complete